MNFIALNNFSQIIINRSMNYTSFSISLTIIEKQNIVVIVLLLLLIIIIISSSGIINNIIISSNNYKFVYTLFLYRDKLPPQ